MNRAIVSKQQIAILIGIAGLISAIVAFLIGTRTPPFYLEVSMRSSDSGLAQVYYDVGRGVNTADSTTAPLPDGESTVRLPLPAGEYHAIRFDPIDHGYCRITIHQVAIVDSTGRVVRRFSPEEVSVFHDISEKRITNGEIDLKVKAEESDPSLTIALAAPLVLTPLPSNFWQVALKAFLLCFILASVLGLTWLLLARLRWHWNGLLLCALGAFVFLGARSRFFAPISFDEGVFVWYGSLVNAGSVPYRDIFEPKGPVIFFANALGLSIFGLKGFLFRIVPTTVALASIVLFYLAMIRRRIAAWLSALLTAQVALWLFSSDFHDTGLNDSETYGFTFTILGFSIGTIASSFERRSMKITLQLLSGICFGLAVLSKEIFVFSVVPAWLLLGIHREGGGWNRGQLFLLATGGAATEVLFLTYLGTHSAFGSYLELLKFSRTFATNYCVDIGRFPHVFGWAVLPPIWKMLHAHLYNFTHLAFVLALGAVIVPIRRILKQGPSVIEAVIATSAVVLGIVSISIGYCFWKHYFFLGTTGLLLISIIGAESLTVYLRHTGRRTRQGSYVILIAAFLFVAWTPTRIMLSDTRSYDRIASWDPLVSETIERHSKPGDYILAPALPVIFVALDRRNPYPPGGPTDDIIPYLAAANPKLRMEALREQLEQNLPKVCYFVNWFRPYQTMWHRLLYDPLLVKYRYIPVNENLWYLPDDSSEELPEGY